MATPRLAALQNLASNLPAANKRIAVGASAARDMQLQKAVAAAPTSAPITSTAQNTGASMAAQAGQQAVQSAGQQVQQAGQIAQVGLGEQKLQGQAEVASAQSGAREEQFDQATKFAKLNADLKKSLYDDTMKFQKDELGRTKFNDVQMADYARANAQSDEQYNNYAQKAQLIQKRSLQIMEHANKLMMKDLEQKQRMAEKEKDQQSFLEIEQMKAAARAALEKKKRKAANAAAAWGAGGTIIGTVAGTVLGGPAGGAAGASVGGAVGSTIGGSQA